MPARQIGPASCWRRQLASWAVGGSKNQASRDAPIPGGTEKTPAPTWYSKFLGLDRKPETTRSSATPAREPYIQPFDPVPTGRPETSPASSHDQHASAAFGHAGAGLDGSYLGSQHRFSRHRGIPIRQAVPDSAQLLRTDPPASLQGSRLVWSMPSLAAGGTQEVMVVYRPAKAGFVACGQMPKSRCTPRLGRSQRRGLQASTTGFAPFPRIAVEGSRTSRGQGWRHHHF